MFWTGGVACVCNGGPVIVEAARICSDTKYQVQWWQSCSLLSSFNFLYFLWGHSNMEINIFRYTLIFRSWILLSKPLLESNNRLLRLKVRVPGQLLWRRTLWERKGQLMKLDRGLWLRIRLIVAIALWIRLIVAIVRTWLKLKSLAMTKLKNELTGPLTVPPESEVLNL